MRRAAAVPESGEEERAVCHREGFKLERGHRRLERLHRDRREDGDLLGVGEGQDEDGPPRVSDRADARGVRPVDRHGREGGGEALPADLVELAVDVLVAEQRRAVLGMNHRREDLPIAARRGAPVLEVDLLRGLVVQNDHVAQDPDELAVRRHADKDAWRRKEEGRCCAFLDGLVLDLDDRRQVGVPNDDGLVKRTRGSEQRVTDSHSSSRSTCSTESHAAEPL